MSAAEKLPDNSAPSTEEKPKRQLSPEFLARTWKPGQSGNPGGRKKSLATVVREVIGDDSGLSMAEWFRKVRDGELSGFGGRERLEAAKWLADRGFGKEVATTVNVNADPETSEAANELSRDALESLARGLKGPKDP